VGEARQAVRIGRVPAGIRIPVNGEVGEAGIRLFRGSAQDLPFALPLDEGEFPLAGRRGRHLAGFSGGSPGPHFPFGKLEGFPVRFFRSLVDGILHLRSGRGGNQADHAVPVPFNHGGMGHAQSRARQVQQGGRGGQHKAQGGGFAQRLVLRQGARPAGGTAQPHLEGVQIHDHLVLLRQPVQAFGVVELLRRITQDGHFQRGPGRGGAYPQRRSRLGSGQGHPVRLHAVAHVLGAGIGKKHVVHGSAEHVLPAARAAVPVIVPRPQPQVFHLVIGGRHPEGDAQPQELFPLGGGIHSDGGIDDAVAEHRPGNLPGEGKAGAFRPELRRNAGHAGRNDGGLHIGILRLHGLHLHLPLNLAPDPGVVVHRGTVRLERHRIAGQNQVLAAVPEGGKHAVLEGGGKALPLHHHGIALAHGDGGQRRRSLHGSLLLHGRREPLVSFALVRHMLQLFGGKLLHVFRQLEPGVRQNHQGARLHGGGRQFHRHGLAGGRLRQSHALHGMLAAGREGHQVKRIALQRLVEILVANGQGTVLAVKGHVLVHLLYFLRLGRGVPVAQNDAVVAEIGLVGPVPEHAAVGLRHALEGSGLVNAVPGRVGAEGLVHKIPDGPAHHARGGLKGFHVLLEIAQGIPHGMGVFAHEEGAGSLLPPPVFHPVHGRIHGGIHVHGLMAVREFAVMEGARIVIGPDGFRGRFKIRPVAGLVAQGPEHDGGMVLGTVHHAHVAFHMRLLP